MRARYTAPVQSAQGVLQAGATVSVFANGSTSDGTEQGTLITGTVYGDGISSTPLTNPFICTGGTIDFYLAYPLRVDLGVQVPGQAAVYYADVDVLRAGIAQTVVTSNYTLSLSDQLLLVSAAGGDIALQLPGAAQGLEYMIKRTDTVAGNTVTVLPPAGVMIDNSLTVPLSAVGGAVSHLRLWSDGTQYWEI